MNKGDLVIYCGSSGKIEDYSIVTAHQHDTLWWAYWSQEKKTLTFETTSPCYTKVGPSVLGKW